MKWFLLLSLLSTQSIYASSTDVENLAFLFYQNKLSAPNNSPPNGNCYPRTSCLEVICKKLSSYECDTTSEIAEVILACKGNINGDCVSSVISALPSYESDTKSEMAEIAKTCSKVHGSSCLDLYKKNLPSYDYDTKKEVFDILSQCNGANYEVVECAKFTCEKLPSYNCDTKYEIDNILKTCGK